MWQWDFYFDFKYVASYKCYVFIISSCFCIGVSYKRIFFLPACLSFHLAISLCRLESQVLLLTFKGSFLGSEVVLKSQEPFFDFSQQIKVDVFHWVYEHPSFSLHFVHVFWFLLWFTERARIRSLKDCCSPQFFHLGAIKIDFPPFLHQFYFFSTIISCTIIYYFSIPSRFSLPHLIFLPFFFVNFPASSSFIFLFFSLLSTQ